MTRSETLQWWFIGGGYLTLAIVAWRMDALLRRKAEKS